MNSSVEIKALLAIVLVYTTRMLGLFMVLPVLALNSDQYIGSTPFLIGLALGIYGLMQALLQVPMGRLSDRIGRKPVILAGLALFALGSLLAAFAHSIEALIFARAVQGAGAVSAALLALLSECSREQHRSKLMAILGVSIGLSFGIAMVVGPLIAVRWGVSAIFWICILLAFLGAIAILTLTPARSHSVQPVAPSVVFAEPLQKPELRRLNFGIFILHAGQMSLWVAVPVLLLERFAVAEADQWQWYLLAVGGGFFLMAPVMQIFAKRNWYRTTVKAGILSLMLAQMVLLFSHQFVFFILGLLIFFWGFNLLEATLPSLVSRWVDDAQRGRVMGWYAASQFTGTFVGGSVGGFLAGRYGLTSVFWLGLCLFVLWLAVSIGMKPLPNIRSFVLSGFDMNRAGDLANRVGVVSVRNFARQGETFVRVDMDRIESETLEAYNLR